MAAYATYIDAIEYTDNDSGPFFMTMYGYGAYILYEHR